MSTRVVAVVLGAFAVLALTILPASAHAVLVSSDPSNGADLPRAPALVSVTFDEAVGLRPGYLHVIDNAGRRVDVGAAFHPGGHDDTVTVRLRRGLGRAAFIASYRVISADSHPVSGVVEFTVGGAAPATAHASARSTDAFVAGLFDAARSVTFLGLALAGGAWLLVLIRRQRGVVAPARADPATWRPVRYGAVLAGAGLTAEFLLQGPYAAGERITAVTDPALLGDTASSAFGRWHLLAIVLLAGLSVVVLPRRRDGLRRDGRRRDGLRLVPAAALLWIAASAWIAVLAAVAASGHAGVRAPVWLGLPVTVAHLLAMTTWIGGLAVLAVVVLPRPARPADADGTARVLPVFSRVAMACVATLAVTGTYQAWREVGSWSALFDTTYGELVLTKIELFAVLIALGAVARARVAGWPSAAPAGPRAATQLRSGVMLELGIAAAVLCVSGVLVAQPPGRDAARAAQTTATATVTAPLSATRTVTVHVTPNRHGVVTIEVDVSAGPAVQKLTVTAAQNAAGVGPLPVVVRATGGGYRSGPATLPVAGDWQFTVTVQTSAFDVATATATLHLN